MLKVNIYNQTCRDLNLSIYNVPSNHGARLILNYDNKSYAGNKIKALILRLYIVIVNLSVPATDVDIDKEVQDMCTHISFYIR